MGREMADTLSKSLDNRSRRRWGMPRNPIDPDQAQDLHRFTVLSYNVGNGLAHPGRLAGYLQHERADIIGLQELSDAQAEEIEARLKHLYPYQALHPGGFHGKGLLSRTPITEVARAHFSVDRPDMHALAEVHGRLIRVIVAHPRPPKFGRTGIVFDFETEEQLQMVAALASGDDPAVILGDFNMTWRHQQHARYTGSGLVDAFHAAGSRAASFPRRVGNAHRFGLTASRLPLVPVIRIDYVWHTPHLEASRVWVGGDAGSDHLPVLARLSWREPIAI